MSSFSSDWLDLRENADRRARDDALLTQAWQWLSHGRASSPHPVVVDLGAGTGATVRAFSSIAPMSPTWRLVDHDPTLLAEARHRHGEQHRIETCHADLTRITSLPLENAWLITASALFDLVSDNFIEALAARLENLCTTSPAGLYSALSYDGTTRWTPAHPLDDTVLEAFNRDQRKDKGFGPALGPRAGIYMERVFTKAGFAVHTADSPWELDGSDHAMVSALIDGIAAAALSAGVETTALDDWRRFRHSHVITGTCRVGHTDLLALPVANA